jgi:hypothetical protein
MNKLPVIEKHEARKKWKEESLLWEIIKVG